MEKLVCNWSDGRTLPQQYVFPQDMRPGNIPIITSNTVPVINFQNAQRGYQERPHIISQILDASQEYGFFQVINHGVSENLIEEMASVCKEFFELPDVDKATIYSEDPTRSCRLYTSNNYTNEEVHLWRDNLRHPCHPLADWLHSWPQKPARYRDVVGEYSIEVRKLAFRILEMISQGLGLEPDYFEDELTKMQLLSVNHYPPCPDPSLTLGLFKHCDPNLITILFQGDTYGLQVFKDGQWHGVEPLPNAFVVNIGYQLQIISNGKFRSAEHRAVTNSKNARTTIVTFVSPDADAIVEPAEVLTDNGNNRPLYKAFQYKEFLGEYAAKVGDTETALESYKVS